VINWGGGAAPPSLNPEKSEQRAPLPNTSRKLPTSLSQGEGKLSPVAMAAPSAPTAEGARPAHWLTKPQVGATALVPSGANLSPPSAHVTIGKKDWELIVHGHIFERVALQPQEEISISFTWPSEHKIKQVAVQGVHGGTVNGEIGQVLSVDPSGVFSFRFKPSRNPGHDEVVMTSGNVSYTIPVWVVGKNMGTPPVINPQ
jgi:hypothetical protein